MEVIAQIYQHMEEHQQEIYMEQMQQKEPQAQHIKQYTQLQEQANKIAIIYCKAQIYSEETQYGKRQTAIRLTQARGIARTPTFRALATLSSYVVTATPTPGRSLSTTSAGVPLPTVRSACALGLPASTLIS